MTCSEVGSIPPSNEPSRLDDMLEGRGRKPTVELVIGATGRLIDDPKEIDRWLDELRQRVLRELDPKHRVRLR